MKVKWVFTTVCAFAMTTSPVLAQWSQFQGDAGHTGYAAGSINAPSLIPLWSIDVPVYMAGFSRTSGVAIVDGKVYATLLNGSIYRGPYLLSAFNGQDGSVLWQQSIRGSSNTGGSVFGNVVLTDDYAFVNASNAVHAINLQTQQSVWSIDGLTGNLAVDNGLLIVSNPKGVYAFAEASSLTPKSVPEPTTIWGLATALGFGVLSKRLHSKKQPSLTLK
jgi:outer membrane protein assembly factor BamB